MKLADFTNHNILPRFRLFPTKPPFNRAKARWIVRGHRSQNSDIACGIQLGQKNTCGRVVVLGIPKTFASTCAQEAEVHAVAGALSVSAAAFGTRISKQPPVFLLWLYN